MPVYRINPTAPTTAQVERSVRQRYGITQRERLSGGIGVEKGVHGQHAGNNARLERFDSKRKSPGRLSPLRPGKQGPTPSLPEHHHEGISAVEPGDELFIPPSSET
jgi:hypothetical protein